MTNVPIPLPFSANKLRRDLVSNLVSSGGQASVLGLMRKQASRGHSGSTTVGLHFLSLQCSMIAQPLPSSFLELGQYRTAQHRVLDSRAASLVEASEFPGERMF